MSPVPPVTLWSGPVALQESWLPFAYEDPQKGLSLQRHERFWEISYTPRYDKTTEMQSRARALKALGNLAVMVSENEQQSKRHMPFVAGFTYHRMAGFVERWSNGAFQVSRPQPPHLFVGAQKKINKEFKRGNLKDEPGYPVMIFMPTSDFVEKYTPYAAPLMQPASSLQSEHSDTT